jgi:hypothetical protein
MALAQKWEAPFFLGFATAPKSNSLARYFHPLNQELA